MNGAIVERWLAMGVLCGAAAVLTALLRWAAGGQRSGFPTTAWAILGGTLAGILMGPTILGRILPDDHERWFSGGVQQRIERDQLISRHGADLIAAGHAQMDDEARSILAAQHERELATATADWRAGQWSDHTPMRWLVAVVVAMILFHGGARMLAISSPSQPLDNSAPPPLVMHSALSIGLCAAIVPGGLTFIAMVTFWHIDHARAAVIASAVAIGPWILTAFDCRAADDAELGGARLMQMAGRVAMALALIAAAGGLWFSRGMSGAWMALPLFAISIGWLFAGTVSERRGITGTIEFLLLPALAAMVCVKIEWIAHATFWPLIVVLLLCDDGRWLGAFLGAILPGGRTPLRTTRLVIGSMSAGITQLAVAAIALHADAMPEFIALTLLAGSLLMEFTTPLRRSLVAQLHLAEEDIEP